MTILYNSKDITADVEINMLDVTEDCGTVPDNIEAVFDNPENLWSDWKPTKNDTIEVTHEGYKSGTMYIDEIEQANGLVVFRALSIPVGAKTMKSKSWENVTLTAIAAELAASYGFAIECFGVQLYSYQRVDQVETSDFAFLQERCTYEGLSMKVTDKKIIIYADHYMEQMAAVKTISQAMFFEEPIFKNKSAEIYSKCMVIGFAGEGSFTDSGASGSVLNKNIDVSSRAEAERFAKNILRSHNKKEHLGKITTALDTSITAGNTIQITGTGLSDGKYFIDNAKHSFANKTSTFKIHKCLERY